MATLTIKNIVEAIYHSGNAKKSAEFLKRRRLLGKKDSILKALNDLVNQKEGIVEAKVTSAESLNESTRQDLVQNIEKRYDAKKVSLTESVKPELLGGIKIEVGDEVIDLTIKNRIKNLAKHLKN